MICLDERLQAVLNEIEPCGCLADIGTDHGKIAVTAKLNGLADYVIAADISLKSVNKAAMLAANYGADVDIRTGNGVEVLRESEYDCVVIAGMGGLEIIEILAKAIKKFNRYVFVPHTKASELRKFMSDNDIKAVKDYKVKAGRKFYDVIAAVPGKYRPNDAEIYYGAARYGDTFSEYRKSEIVRLNKLIDISGENKKSILRYKSELLLR